MLDRHNQGITLIALVITIIVLLILAGLTISLALGENGIFKRALQAKQETRISEVKEEAQRWLLNNEINEKLGYKESIVSTEDFLKELKDKGKITEEEYNKAIQSAKSENPKIVINNGKEDVEIPLKRQDGTGSNEKSKEKPSNPSKPEPASVDNKSIKRGDIIKYDPKRDVTDANLLKYTSPKGNTSDTTYAGGGNGHSDQTFTVEDNMNEWVVYKNENGKLTIVAKEPTSQKMALKGGQGWLYAERELNKACSIYGHGKGADKSHVTRYEIGNPCIALEKEEETIAGSGARSLKYQDITGDEILYSYVPLKKTMKIPIIKSDSSTKESDNIYREQVYLTHFYDGYYDFTSGDKFTLLMKKKEYWVAVREISINHEMGFFTVFSVTPFERKYYSSVREIIRSNDMFRGYYRGDVVENGAQHSLLPVCNLAQDIELVLEEKRDDVNVYSIK